MKLKTLAVGLALLMLLAGCSGGSGGGDPTATVTEAGTPTDVPTDTPSTDVEFEESLEVSNAYVQENQYDRFDADSGSYTVNASYSVTYEGDDQSRVSSSATPHVYSRVAMHGSSGTYGNLSVSDGEYWSTEVYRSDDMESVRVWEADGDYRSNVGEMTPESPYWYRADLYGANQGEVLHGTYEFDGLTTVNGERVGRYVLTDTTDVGGFNRVALSPYDNMEVTTVESEVFVTEQGLIVAGSYRAEVSAEGFEDVFVVEGEYEVTDVGSTTVDKPDWVTEF